MSTLRRLLTTVGLGAGMIAGSAFGSTITQTFTVPTGGTEVADTTSNRAFNYFGSYGLVGQTLTAVTLQFTGTEQLTSLSIFNAQPTTQYYTYAVVGDLTVDSIANQNGNGAATLGDTAALNSLSNGGFGFSGNVWALGTGSCYMGIGAGATQSWITGSTASPTAPSRAGAGQNPSTLASCTPAIQSANGLLSVDSGVVNGTTSFYLGTGQFNLSFITSTSGNFINSNIASGVSSSTVAGGTYTVVYTYGPSGAPEPTTMVLFGSALIGLGIMRRRGSLKR